MASIFCSREDSEAGLVTSLAVQLLRVRKARGEGMRKIIPINILQTYERRRNTDVLWELLRTVISDNSLVTIVIDGIDKLYPSIRSSFLDGFLALKESHAGNNMQVMVSSTPDNDIEHFLRNFPHIDREKERRGEN
jgi:hypothetical protein